MMEWWLILLILLGAIILYILIASVTHGLVAYINVFDYREEDIIAAAIWPITIIIIPLYIVVPKGINSSLIISIAISNWIQGALKRRGDAKARRKKEEQWREI
jgi:hypothetical protein